MKKLLFWLLLIAGIQFSFAQKTMKDLGNKPAEYRTMIQGATVNGNTAFSQLSISTRNFEQSVKKTEDAMKAKGFKMVDKATALFDNYGVLDINYQADAKMVYVAKIFYSSFDGTLKAWWKHPQTPGIGTLNKSSGYSPAEQTLTLDEYSPATDGDVQLHIETSPASGSTKQYTAVQVLIFKKKK